MQIALTKSTDFYVFSFCIIYVYSHRRREASGSIDRYWSCPMNIHRGNSLRCVIHESFIERWFHDEKSFRFRKQFGWRRAIKESFSLSRDVIRIFTRLFIEKLHAIFHREPAQWDLVKGNVRELHCEVNNARETRLSIVWWNYNTNSRINVIKSFCFPISRAFWGRWNVRAVLAIRRSMTVHVGLSHVECSTSCRLGLFVTQVGGIKAYKNEVEGLRELRTFFTTKARSLLVAHCSTWDILRRREGSDRLQTLRDPRNTPKAFLDFIILMSRVRHRFEWDKLDTKVPTWLPWCCCCCCWNWLPPPPPPPWLPGEVWTF